jgi:hypothetical protein
LNFSLLIETLALLVKNTTFRICGFGGTQNDIGYFKGFSGF